MSSVVSPKRSLQFWIAFWALSGLVLVAASRFLSFVFLLLALVWIASGLVSAVLAVTLAVSSRDRRWYLGAASSVVALGLVLYFSSSWVANLGFIVYARYQVSEIEDHVDEILSRHRGAAPNTASHESDDELGYIVVDGGPPIRIAFVLPGGIIDNWCGVVFDPTGEVLRVNAFEPDWSNWNDPELSSVKRLFGGDMLSCRDIGPPYYACCFT